MTENQKEVFKTIIEIVLITVIGYPLMIFFLTL